MAKAVTFFVGQVSYNAVNHCMEYLSLTLKKLSSYIHISKLPPLYEKNTDPNGCAHHRFLQ